ncbi:hypothetical protein Cni_G12835 [Canna indica]|uniref:Uncharacterized protein n=1 Tax=Canna indica TaxID=4628 RepID=A0AAQ3KA56_9LILI|nr:hypothetical protein Cni_G12835 [Canna indica]
MASPKTLLGIFLVISASAASAEIEASRAPTAYELLEKYDFPRGILPEGVQSYLLLSDGSFDVYFAADCEFGVAGYTLRYSRKVSGKVQPGKLTDLKGVSVKLLFLWIGIDKVEVTDDDQLKFYVGLFSASFPVSNFDESPRCRCGFDCAAANADAVLVSDD